MDSHIEMSAKDVIDGATRYLVAQKDKYEDFGKFVRSLKANLSIEQLSEYDDHYRNNIKRAETLIQLAEHSADGFMYIVGDDIWRVSKKED